jgi:hypothetical protein
MAKLVADNVVVTPKKVTDADNADFASLRKVALEQSPVSQRDPATIAKGK